MIRRHSDGVIAGHAAFRHRLQGGRHGWRERDVEIWKGRSQPLRARLSIPPRPGQMDAGAAPMGAPVWLHVGTPGGRDDMVQAVPRRDGTFVVAGGASGVPPGSVIDILGSAPVVRKCACRDARPWRARVVLKGVGHSVEICDACGRLTPAAPRRFAAALFCTPALQKGAIPSGCYHDPESCNLRWITAHPHGDDAEGVPLLVHDDGTHYTVVGGAGGRLNHAVFAKPAAASKDEQKSRTEQRKAQRRKLLEEKEKENPEWMNEQKAKLDDIHQAIKAQTSELKNRVLERILGNGGDANKVLEAVKAAARAQAEKTAPDGLSAVDKDALLRAAEKGAVAEVKKQAAQVVHAALDHQALREMGDEDTSQELLQEHLKDNPLLKKFTPEELEEFVQQSATAAGLRAQARAISRSLSENAPAAVSGLDVHTAPLSAEEVRAQNLDRYMNERDVDQNVAMIRASRSCSPITQKRYIALGAMDAINGVVGEMLSESIMSPEHVNLLGVEGAARIAAAVLAERGVDTDAASEHLHQQIAQHSGATVAAALAQCDEMDNIVAGAIKAADDGGGSLSRGQASAMAMEFAQRKYRLLNSVTGELRAAAALAVSLGHKSTAPLMVATTSHAAGEKLREDLGLTGEQAQVKKNAVGKGYVLEIGAKHLAGLAAHMPFDRSERAAQVAEIRADVEAQPGLWQPKGTNPDIRFLPHQELAIRANVQMKRMINNYGAGSGKTSILYATAAHLLSEGKIDRAIITMPAKPLSQQEGDQVPKFLSPELAAQTVVVRSGAELKKAVAAVQDGSKKIVVMGPELMKRHVDSLLAAGFGKERTMCYFDEAHEMVVGQGQENQMTQRATGARRLADGAEYCYAGSGSLIQKTGSDLHSIYDMIHPGELGSRKTFGDEWKRLSQSGSSLLRGAEASRMRARLAGGMVTYFEPVKARDGKREGETLELHHEVLHVKHTPEQAAAIKKATEQLKKDKASPDDATRAGASLRHYAKVMSILTDGVRGKDGQVVSPKIDAISADMDSRRQTLGEDTRVGLYNFNLAPLREAGKRLGGKFVKVFGENDEAETVQALQSLNDKTSDTRGVLLSRAGVYGINATGMRVLYKMGPMPNQADEEQVDHRHYRLGADEDKYAVTVVTDHPLEQKSMYVSRRVRRPEVALLAEMADDTGMAHAIGRHLDDVRAAASAAPEQGA